MTVLQRRYFGFCCACVAEWLIHRPEYWLRAALSRWKTSPVDYGQIIWSLVDARIFVLGKGDRRVAPLFYTFSRNQKPSFRNMLQRMKWGLVIETHNTLLCILHLKRQNFAPYMPFRWNSAWVELRAMYRGQNDANSWPKLLLTVSKGNCVLLP